MKKDNPFLLFYGRHKISPVHQDIRNFKRHIERRQRLYRLLGIAPAFFKNKTILEVGPGGGYNALAFFFWGADVDFVEPNPAAQKELLILLRRHKIEKNRWKLFPGKIEDFNLEQGYDLVIAEGFLHGLGKEAQKIISKKLTNLVSRKGVLVVTCSDNMSLFFEILKRLLGHILLFKKKTNDFKEKVAVLSRAFGSHLKSLKHASRPVEDWVADNFLNPAIYGNLSIEECINAFKKEFIFLGSSPAMFTDYAWYKDTGFDANKNVIDQFRRKHHLLLLWNMAESQRDPLVNRKLYKKIGDFLKLVKIIENKLAKKEFVNLTSVIRTVKEIRELVKDMDERVSQAIVQSLNLLTDNELSEDKISRAAFLAQAFGRGQQYLSLIRR